MSRTYCIVGEELPCPSHLKCWKTITDGLSKMGYVLSGNIRKSDVILVRHCCMTSAEIEEVICDVKKLCKSKACGKVFLGECISRTDALTNAIRLHLPDLKIFCFTNAEEFFDALGEGQYDEDELSPIVLEDGSAVVSVTCGCNMKCTFCKTSYMNYEFSSTPFEEILAKVNNARKLGYKKVMLDAMNITEYSYDGKGLADLLYALIKIPDVIYQVNGIVMAELSDEALNALQNPRFYCVQVELQSFIDGVRQKMGVGRLPVHRILSIFKALQGKYIISNVMVGFCREHDESFKQQLRIIEENNLFFLTVNNLVPTPGTKSSQMANPSVDTANLRMAQLTRLIMILRKNVADGMIGTQQKCTVIYNTLGNASLALAKNGVLIHVAGDNSQIGTEIKVMPRSVKNYFGVQQAMILSTETVDSEDADLGALEERMIMEISKYIVRDSETKCESSNFNNNPMSLEDYCNMCFSKGDSKVII